MRAKVDAKEVNRLFRSLSMEGKQGKKAIRQACQLALQVIDDETGHKAGAIRFKSAPRPQPFRKAIKKRSGYRFKKVRNRARRFWMRSMVSYRKAPLKISHLVEKGFRHFQTGKKVPGYWFREKAFESKKDEAMRVLRRALLQGMSNVSNNRKMSLTELRGRVRNGV